MKKSIHDSLVDYASRVKKSILIDELIKAYDGNEEKLLSTLRASVENSFDYRYNKLLKQEKALREDIEDFESHYCLIHDISQEQFLDTITPEKAEEYNAMLDELKYVVRRENKLREESARGVV